MMLMPPTDLDLFSQCGYTQYRDATDSVGHPCGKPAVASAVGPHGERLALCAVHERTAIAAVSLPRFSDWLIEETN